MFLTLHKFEALRSVSMGVVVDVQSIVREFDDLKCAHPGHTVEVSGLADAKRIASRKYAGEHAVLAVEDFCGNLIAYKDRDGWTNIEKSCGGKSNV